MSVAESPGSVFSKIVNCILLLPEHVALIYELVFFTLKCHLVVFLNISLVETRDSL